MNEKEQPGRKEGRRCTYVAHLSHDGLLLLAEVVLVVLGNLLVQVLVDLQHLMTCVAVHTHALIKYTKVRPKVTGNRDVSLLREHGTFMACTTASGFWTQDR